MTDEGPIICRPTKWFLWRAVAMLLMFGVFFVLFIKDWRVGYPRKNVVYYTYQAFETARKEFKGKSASEWEAFAGDQTIPYPDEPGILPADVSVDSPWPEALRDHEAYRKAYEGERDQTAPPMWLDYSNAQGWNSKPPEKAYDAGKIREQLYYGIGAGVLTLMALFYLVRTQGRSMMVDGEAYVAPGGARIPFGRIRRIDKRKWESKGLAYLYYEAEGGEERKAKVDGMVYGQFKEEDGAPAEQLFQRILRNFSGELIELELPAGAGSGAEADSGEAEEKQD
jgi:hypothetical protein